MKPEKLTYHPFYPVPDNSRPLLSAHGKAQTDPAGAATMTQHKKYKTFCVELFPLLIAEVKFRLFQELMLLCPI